MDFFDEKVMFPKMGHQDSCPFERIRHMVDGFQQNESEEQMLVCAQETEFVRRNTGSTRWDLRLNGHFRIRFIGGTYHI